MTMLKPRSGMRLTADDTLTTPLLPGLAIPLADVFRHHRRPVEESH